MPTRPDANRHDLGPWWWGYRHKDGGCHAKRFFDPRDIESALESPFVVHIVEPFRAKDHDTALRVVDLCSTPVHVKE